jgi:hypothetical protein
MKFFSLMFLVASLFTTLTASAAAVEPSIQWINSDGTKTLVNEQTVLNSTDYPLGYFHDLLEKKDLCFNGDAQEVLRKIINNETTPGFDPYGDEQCNRFEVKRGMIKISKCKMEGLRGSYGLKIGTCNLN